MTTNLALDDRLLDEALKVGGKPTKKATVTEALQEYIARRKQARIADLFGAIDYDEGTTTRHNAGADDIARRHFGLVAGTAAMRARAR